MIDDYSEGSSVEMQTHYVIGKELFKESRRTYILCTITSDGC